MDSLQIVKRAALPESLIMGVGAVFAGSGAAVLRGEIEIAQAIICLLFAIFTQLTANFLHRYNDVTHQYGASIDDNFYSETFRLDSAKLVTREGTIAMFIISMMLGITLLPMTAWWMIIPGALIYLLMFLTNGGPYPLFRSGIAPLPPFLLFGVFGVGFSAYAQVMYDNPDPQKWYYTAPMLFFALAYGVMAANVQLIFNFSSYQKDRENYKMSFTVKYGRKATIALVAVNGLLMIGLLSVFAFTQHVRQPALFLIGPAVCFIVNSLLAVWMNNPRINYRYLSKTAMVNAFILGLWILVICIILGDPDRSRLVYYPEQIMW